MEKRPEEELWGESQLFCSGRFIAGPDARSAAATSLLVVVPSIMWQVIVGPWFTERYSVLFALIGILFSCASFSLLLATAFSDPGIMPRQPDFTEQVDEVSGATRIKQPSRYFDTVLNGHTAKLKYCVTCHIYRPPRCTHCSVCENCVERFDHHCPWIGNCIGKRNYRLFYGFVSSTGFLNAYTLATCIALLAIRGKEITVEQSLATTEAFVETMREEPFTLAIGIYATLSVWFTVGLCMYHTYLICTNQTTYEQIKGFYAAGINPFDRGSFPANCQDVLLAPVRPRYFDGRTRRTVWPKVSDVSFKHLSVGAEHRTQLPSTPGGTPVCGSRRPVPSIAPPAATAATEPSDSRASPSDRPAAAAISRPATA